MIDFTMGAVQYRVFDHLYAVSACGKVLRQMEPCRLRQRPDGYLEVGRNRLVHRMVAQCWMDNFDPEKDVHHVNEQKADNRVENLQNLSRRDHIGEHDGVMGRYARTEETRAKLRAFRTGFKDTEEVKARKRAILLQVHPRTPCKFAGVEYPSVAAGARAADLPAPTFRQRCLSKNFPEYELL